MSAPGPVPYVIDPASCRMCGREEAGLRCDQCVTQGYHRQLVRVRTSQERLDPTPWPLTAPCGDACPLSLCIQGYATHLAAAEHEEALRHVLIRTPLPETVCRVCDRPCESVCVRGALDGAVAINDLKRFLVGWGVTRGVEAWLPELGPETGRSVAVVGAGPAGLSAAFDLRVRGHAVVLYDEADAPGGVLARHIPRYRLPPEALARDVARILSAGVRFEGGRRLSRDLHLAELVATHDAVVLAIGAHRPRRLSLPGRDAEGAPPLVDALGFLERARRDEPALDGSVVVIGGGNAAVDAARTALRLGAREVAMSSLEGREAMPALPEEVVAAVAEGVALHPGTRPLRLERGAVVVAGVEGAGDAGRDETSRLEASLVVVAIGQEPAEGFLAGGPDLALDEAGLVAVDPETCRTSHPRVWAAGDLVAGKRTVTRAIAAGLRVAWSIDRELRGAELADLRRPPLPPRTPERPWPALRTRHVARRHAPEQAPRDRAASFEEVAGAFSEEEARAEASRCLACGSCGNCRACVDLFGCPAIGISGGKASIDPALCNGCGVCAAFCPNGAIRPGVAP